MFQANRSQGKINHITGDIHFIAMAMKRRRTVLTIHDCRLLSEFKGIKYYFFKWFWFSLPMHRVRVITTVSEATKRELLKYIDISPAKIQVIPISISEIYKRSPKPFNKQCPRILQVGTAPNKNLKRMLQAVAEISCHVHIVGTLSEDVVQTLALYDIRHSVNTNLTENQLLDEYKNCDILSFVSTYEGFGMPIVEANAVGRVVVTSDILSMPEVAGDSACLVDPYNVESIRSGFARVIEDDQFRNLLLENGFINCKRFDVRKTAAKFTELYTKILEDSDNDT